MRITIQRDLENFIQEKVEVGRYRDADEAINDGLRMLKQRDEEEFQRLRQLIKGRMKEARRGESVPFDAAVTEAIRRRGMKRLAALKRART
jgi:putative addiction module CopG family antidote